MAAATPAWAGPPSGAPACPAAGHAKHDLDVMQVNTFIGGGIDRVAALDPTDPNYLNNLVTTVSGVFYEIIASDPEARLSGVADRISNRMPELVSISEGSLLRLESPGDLIHGGLIPATNVVFDYLQILTNALAARGAHYKVAAVIESFDAELPMFNLETGTIDDARLTDRTAILARADLPPGQFRVSNPRGGNFTNVVVTAAGLPLLYGWCSVDVVVRGQSFRYIAAHLTQEVAPQIQALQARELLAGPANVRQPVFIVGDFNSDPLGRDGSYAYGLFPAAGFRDAWAALHPRDRTGGLTWGHDEYLADPGVAFDRRIDLVFYRGTGIVPTRADVVDMDLGSTPPLWASDHAAVTAEFQLLNIPQNIPAPDNQHGRH